VPGHRGVARRHIRLDAASGGGARFVVELPGEPGTSSAAPALEDAAPVAPLSVLVVDDEPDVAESTAELLRYSGHQVDLCHRGADAIEQARRRDDDLILLDLRMPDVDGARVYAALAEGTPPLGDRVVFCSGDSLTSASADFLERTGALVLAKPFSMDDIGRVVRLHTARRAGVPVGAGAP
jgi:DNA-binding response OmpR family regulator